jgi:hypothetical protein
MEELCKNGELHIGDGAYIMPGTTVVKVSHWSKIAYPSKSLIQLRM